MEKKLKNLSVLILIAFIFVIIIIPILFFESIDENIYSKLIEYFGILGAIGGIIAIYFQMRREKNISEGEFIYSLYDGFSNNENFKKIYNKLEICNSTNCRKDPFNKEEIGYIIDYLSFFETMYLLIKRGILTIDLIDELFSYRYFIAVHNPFVQKHNLLKYDIYYKNSYRLHKMWIDHRIKKGRDIPFSEYRLDKINKNYNQLIKN